MNLPAETGKNIKHKCTINVTSFIEEGNERLVMKDLVIFVVETKNN